MRKFLFLLLTLAPTTFSTAQNYHYIDSLKKVLNTQKEDTAKVNTLFRLSKGYGLAKADSELFFAQKALELANKLNYNEVEPGCYFNLSRSSWIMGNYYKGIQLATKSYETAEVIHDTSYLILATLALCANYRDEGDYANSLKYAYQCKRIGDSLNIHDWDAIPAHIASVYEKYNQLDSALVYAQKAYEIVLTLHNGNAWIPRLLGDIHSKMKHFELALAFYHIAVLTELESPRKYEVIASYNGIANIFKEKKQPDSVIFYSKEIMNNWNSLLYTRGLMQATANLANAYESKGIADSTLKYLKLSIALKDSLYSQEKIMQVQNLAFTEQERQREMNEKKIKEKEQRAHNLQYALLGIGLISFLIIFFLLSHSIIVRTGFVRFLGVLGLLAVFEFINLYIHPYLSGFTNDSPLWMLLILVTIGALLVPLHHKIETKVLKIMVEKNKKIRLAAAKKTIARLEGK